LSFLPGNFYHFTYVQPFTAATQKPRIEFNKHLFSTTKSFDNLFFEGKQVLIDRLNFYLDNSDFYQQRGIAHSLGLLFYGAPGKLTFMSFELAIPLYRLWENINDQSNRLLH
jgi:hypothetical protein